jgi:hypothetical protein
MQYTDRFCPPTCPICDDMWMIDPPFPAATNPRATACETKYKARWFNPVMAS